MSQLPPPSQPLPYATYLPPPKPRPTSVTVIAIIGIILAGLAILGGLCSIPQYLGVEFGPNPVMDGIRHDPLLQGYTVGSLVVGVILALVLLWAAMGLLSLKRSARTGIIWYAIVNLVISVAGQIFNLIVINPRMQQVTQSAIKSSPMLNTPTMKVTMQYSLYGGICLGLAMLIWPVSILYFMTRPHVISAFERGLPGNAGNPP